MMVVGLPTGTHPLVGPGDRHHGNLWIATQRKKLPGDGSENAAALAGSLQPGRSSLVAALEAAVPRQVC